MTLEEVFRLATQRLKMYADAVECGNHLLYASDIEMALDDVLTYLAGTNPKLDAIYEGIMNQTIFSAAEKIEGMTDEAS